MKSLRITIFLLFCTALAACSEKHESFYTINYPVVRVDASVALNSAAGGDGTTDPADDALIATIRQAVTSESLMQAGGNYRLEFERADGGSLYITPTPNGERIPGSFIKQPNVPDSLELIFLGHDYYYALSGYVENDSQLLMLSFDLTKQFQALYPDDGVKQVVRREYTSLPY